MPRFTILLLIACLAFGYMGGYTHAFFRLHPDRNQDNSTSSPVSGQPSLFSKDNEQQPFANIIKSTTKHEVIPITDSDQYVLDAIKKAANATLDKLNEPTSPLVGLRRINEASRHFEDSLREWIDVDPLLECTIPLNASGKTQRSGYPDLVITHLPSGDIYYLDPQLYEASSKDSTLRTFYYSPRSETSKILTDARHLLIGFSHDGKDGQWTFDSWTLIDLSKINLRLKSEFNASNRDLYTPAATLLSNQR